MLILLSKFIVGHTLDGTHCTPEYPCCTIHTAGEEARAAESSGVRSLLSCRRCRHDKFEKMEFIKILKLCF